MKKPQSGILGLSVVAALFLAVAGTLPLAAQDIPASSVMPPGYLQAMPAADRVLSDMKVADSVETRARRIAAMSYLGGILDVLTWDHLFVQGGRSGLTPEEDSLRRGYRNAWSDLFSGSGNVPGLTALMTRYEAESSPLRSELLDRYFSPAWKAALMALDARYRVVENAPPTVQAEQRAPPGTGQAEQRVPYFANLRCTPGATGAHGKPVSGVEKEACDMATAEIGKHWAKQPDGWTTELREGTDFAPIVFIRQVRSLAVERVKTYELSAADRMNGFEWAGEVWFSKGPAREEGVEGFTLGMAGTIVRPGQWSQWVDYQPLPLRVQRVKGKWEVPPTNKLLEGKLAGVIASQQLEQANAPGRDTRLAVRPAPCEEVCGFISVNVTGAPARPNGRPALAAQVWIDHITAGRTPVINYKVRAGQHTIMVHSRRLFVNDTVQVDSGATVVKSYDGFAQGAPAQVPPAQVPPAQVPPAQPQREAAPSSSDISSALLTAKGIVDGASYDTVRARQLRLSGDTANLAVLRAAYANRLDSARTYLAMALASPDTALRINAAAILVRGGAKLGQANIWDHAYPWLDQTLQVVVPRTPSDTTGPRQQIRIQASFWYGLSSVLTLNDQYRAMVNSRSCTEAKTVSERIARTKEALMLGMRVHPPTVNQMLQNLGKFEDQMPRVKETFGCDNF